MPSADKAPFMEHTYSHLFQTRSISCSHIDIPPPPICSLLHFFSLLLIAIFLAPPAVAPPTRSNPFWHVATDTTAHRHAC